MAVLHARITDLFSSLAETLMPVFWRNERLSLSTFLATFDS